MPGFFPNINSLGSRAFLDLSELSCPTLYFLLGMFPAIVITFVIVIISIDPVIVIFLLPFFKPT